MTEFVSGSALMREIETSVLTWCSKHRPEDGRFHGAVLDEWDPTDEELELGWRNFWEVEGRVPKGLHEVVFRKPTWEHIPDEFGLREAPALGKKATGLPFQPFMHFRYRGGRPVCVLKSNWVGTVSGGRFRMPDDPDGGFTTALSEMLVKLVNRFGMRPNWSGYTDIEDMKSDAVLALLQGMLKFSPLKSSNPFAYATQCMKMAFIIRLNKDKERWSDERLFGHSDTVEMHEDWADGESWSAAAAREFAEAERAFLDANK